MENIEEELKDKIRRLRLEADLTQVALANLTGISVKMIKDIEKGRRGGSANTLQSLSKVFGVSIEELLGSSEIQAEKVKPLPMSKVAQRIASIPDDVYDLAPELFGDEEAWASVIATMRAEAKILKKKQEESSSKHA